MFPKLLILILLLKGVNSSVVPNDLVNRIPDDNSELGAGKSETLLKKIDSETAFCGPRSIDIREITILQLQEAFRNKRLTSKELVQCYLKRIKLMNPHLHAVLETNPRAVEIAQKLDRERDEGVNYGPLHGIPILLKDTMGTNDGMENTGGSTALLGLKPKRDSVVVEKLRKAGAIIIGKANLAEFGNYRASNMPNGWSGRGGRTRNAYVLKENASGSSSGSAVATAANLVAAALGGETDGSIVAPSEYAGLVGLKTTHGRVSNIGVLGISETQDVIGPMVRTVNDAAIIFDVISEDGIASPCFSSERGMEDCDETKAIRLGVIRSWGWRMLRPEQLANLEEILVKLSDVGFQVVDPVETPNNTTGNFSYESKNIVLMHEFKAGMNLYLSTEVHRPRENKIRKLADVIAFNDNHPPSEGYDQVYLTEAEITDGIANSTYLENKLTYRAVAREFLDALLKQYELDAIVAPTDQCGWWSCTLPAASGYPHITVPAGVASNGVPFGISFYGKANSEETLLTIAHHLEKVHPARRPSMFLD